MEIIVQNGMQHFAGQSIDLGIFDPLHAVALDKAGNLFLSDKFKDFRNRLLNDLSHLGIILWIGQPASCSQTQVCTVQTALYNLRRKKIFLHKTAHRLCNTSLITWNDFGMVA